MAEDRDPFAESDAVREAAERVSAFLDRHEGLANYPGQRNEISSIYGAGKGFVALTVHDLRTILTYVTAPAGNPGSCFSFEPCGNCHRCVMTVYVDDMLADTHGI